MTKRLARLCLILISLALAACGSAAEDGATPTSVACRVGPDCDRKWARAIAWVEQNACYKIEKVDAWRIQTFGPYGKSEGTAIAIDKVASGDGWAQLFIHVSCANIVTCYPSVTAQKISFFEYVSGGSNDVVPIHPPFPQAHPIPGLGDPLVLLR
ncbi:hypothetical protein [Methylocystis bryophila]|uniref:Lipoprotein n=1 Tax=Methylocystis bryophila TaxID=655015 RepID=A0A1W6MU13_9HYPH|nr:hypothetical protein [Methylocystis bryophila]ARN80979.1 hypothetical protein B1812_07730 [Methylocystis bryophila]BDV36889.1 hypothetical protein DSM21852_01420 [Methylocystis bryophila]